MIRENKTDAKNGLIDMDGSVRLYYARKERKPRTKLHNSDVTQMAMGSAHEVSVETW